jgi:hypothetical protein
MGASIRIYGHWRQKEDSGINYTATDHYFLVLCTLSPQLSRRRKTQPVNPLDAAKEEK